MIRRLLVLAVLVPTLLAPAAVALAIMWSARGYSPGAQLAGMVAGLGASAALGAAVNAIAARRAARRELERLAREERRLWARYHNPGQE